MTSAVLNRSEIAALIPHDGRMCLLDRVVDWQDGLIHCIAVSHRDADNPMRLDGRLGAVVGIEYAAQAMAIHGALRARRESAAKKGYLTRVQQVQMHVETLDDCAEPLFIEARLLIGNHQIVRYAFSVTGGDRLLLAGQATVMLDAAILG